ncbi:hypothetical protein KKH15_01930 [Patescibacteria group bacterium]|nr:hypothetical protein [Patescibacteria group bacterium]MBU1755111.1 hypothetical protein [Patescibacteria group bacterium]
MSRIEFGLRSPNGKEVVELVAKAEFYCDTPEPSLRCISCGVLGASKQRIVVVSVKDDLGDRVYKKSSLFKRAKKALEGYEGFHGPYCPEDNDEFATISMEGELVG